MNVKHLFEILLFSLFVSIVTSCSRNELEIISYVEFDDSYSADTTCFSNKGEERIFSVNFKKHKYVDGAATDVWEDIPSSTISASVNNGIFKVTYIPESRKIQVFVPENTSEEIRKDSVLITVNDEMINRVISVPVYQAASEVTYQYKIVSEQNPFIIPPGGGEFSIPFTCMQQKTLNGKALDWVYSDMKMLRYESASSRPGCWVDLEAGTETGHYKFHLIVEDSFKVINNKQPLWYYTIRNQWFEGEIIYYLHQSFTSEHSTVDMDLEQGTIIAKSGPITI